MPMASPNDSSSDESPEYSAMREKYAKLVDVLSPSISSLANTLFSQNLILQAIVDKLRRSSTSEADKAGELLSHLMSRVKLDCHVFHKFVKALKEHDPMVAETLMTSYQSHRAVPLKSSESVVKEQVSEPVVFRNCICKVGNM